MPERKNQLYFYMAGFTLIEISIVLVIIGLIIGGVLVGNDLINSSGNRAYISQLENYNAVVNTFKLKYNCLPGDCATATSLGFTVNGNGNGMVSGLSTEPSFSSPDYVIVPTDTQASVYLACCGSTEARYFWAHLRSALLIPEYTTTLGVSDGSGISYSIPTAKNDNTGIIATAWAGKHYYRSGTTSTRGGGNTVWTLNFSPSDAAYIFEKMGGTTITTTVTNVNLYPNGLGKERVLVSGYLANWIGTYDTRFFHPVSKGAGGANSDVCINTSVTPVYFNLQNPKKLCALIIQANF